MKIISFLAPLLFLVIVTGAQEVRAQIAVDSVSGVTGPTSNQISRTWSHTVGSGSNRILIVGVSLKDGAAKVNSVTYGGTALVFIGSRTDSGLNTKIEIWKLVAPATGTANIVVTLSVAKRIVAGSVSFTGVDQTTPNGAFASNAGSNNTPTVNASSASGELVIDTFAVQGDARPATVGAGQTQRWNRATGTSDGNEVLGGGSTEPGAPTVTMSWGLGQGQDWSIGALSLKPAAAAPASISLVKSVSPGGAQIPGTDLLYTISYSNTGGQPANNFIVIDPNMANVVPAERVFRNVDFKVGSLTSSPGTTGLVATFSYSNDGGTTWTYTPVSGAGGASAGYDRLVTNVRWSFTGNLSQTAPNNTASVGFTVRIR